MSREVHVPFCFILRRSGREYAVKWNSPQKKTGQCQSGEFSQRSEGSTDGSGAGGAGRRVCPWTYYSTGVRVSRGGCSSRQGRITVITHGPSTKAPRYVRTSRHYTGRTGARTSVRGQARRTTNRQSEEGRRGRLVPLDKCLKMVYISYTCPTYMCHYCLFVDVRVPSCSRGIR